MKQLIINADDLGICEATNLAICEAHREGVLTSASLMANGPAFEHAVSEVVEMNPQLGIGLHLCLTSGPSLLPATEIPQLMGDDRQFRHGFVSLLRSTMHPQPGLLEQIEAELDAQFQRILAAGISIDHVNGHRYFHLIPAVYDIVVRLMKKHQCSAIRDPREPLGPARIWLHPAHIGCRAGNAIKWFVLSALSRGNDDLLRKTALSRTDHFHGILDSGCVNRRALAMLISAQKNGVTEIATHPGHTNPDVTPAWSAADNLFLKSPKRVLELQALTDPRIRDLIDKREIQLVRFQDAIGAKEAERKIEKMPVPAKVNSSES